MAEDIVLTPSGKKKIEDELAVLRSVEMPALAERIRDARALGDLSENFDYQDAKRQQGFIAGKISDLQSLLDRAKIVGESGSEDGAIGMGSKVTVRDVEFEDEVTYTLVGTYESDPANDMISVASPIGKTLIGHRLGEQVQVATPGGTSTLEIIKID